MRHRDPMLEGLLRAVAWGGTLAAMGCEAEPDSETKTDAEVPALPALPSEGCLGEGDEWVEPPCYEVRCYEPDEGRACVTASAEVPTSEGAAAAALGIDLPFGCESGDFLCGIRGPYDPSDKARYTDDSGRCCYSVCTSSCEGRPLLVGGQLRLAGVVPRGDWT